MNNDPSNVEISVNELKLLVNTLSKSVALSLKKRFAWLWLVAGLLIGVCITLLIINLTGEKTGKISVTSETLLKKTDGVMADLEQINSSIKTLTQTVDDLTKKNSDIKTLTQTVDALAKKNQTENMLPRSPEAPPNPSSNPQPIIQPNNYTVYLHYSDIKNKKLIQKLSAFLKDNGFEVSGIQKVNYTKQDIRFFHDQDKEGAFLLKKYLTGFVQSVKTIKGNNIKIINLSRKYPKAQKGLLEVWVDF